MEKYDLCELIRSLIEPNTHAAEHERAVGHKALDGSEPTRPNGVIIPWEVLAAKSAPVMTDGDALIPTNTRLGDLIKPLTRKSVVASAGALFIGGLKPGESNFPNAENISAHWIDYETDYTQVFPRFSDLKAKPHTVCARVELTRKLIEQGGRVFEKTLVDLIMDAIAAEVDAATLDGTGADGMPLGISRTANVHAIETTPGEVTAANVAQFIDDTTADNADDERLTFVASAEVRKALRDIRRPIVAIKNGNSSVVGGIGGELILKNRAMFDVPLKVTNAAPAKKLLCGDFSNVAVVTWGNGVEVVFDRYSKSKSGALVIVVYLDVDVIVCHPEAFAVGQILEADPEPAPAAEPTSEEPTPTSEEPTPTDATEA